MLFLSCACVSVSGVLFSVGVCVCVTGWSFYTGPGGLWCDRIPFLLHLRRARIRVGGRNLPRALAHLRLHWYAQIVTLR